MRKVKELAESNSADMDANREAVLRDLLHRGIATLRRKRTSAKDGLTEIERSTLGELESIERKRGYKDERQQLLRRAADEISAKVGQRKAEENKIEAPKPVRSGADVLANLLLLLQHKPTVLTVTVRGESGMEITVRAVYHRGDKQSFKVRDIRSDLGKASLDRAISSALRQVVPPARPADDPAAGASAVKSATLILPKPNPKCPHPIASDRLATSGKRVIGGYLRVMGSDDHAVTVGHRTIPVSRVKCPSCSGKVVKYQRVTREQVKLRCGGTETETAIVVERPTENAPLVGLCSKEGCRGIKAIAGESNADACAPTRISQDAGGAGAQGNAAGGEATDINDSDGDGEENSPAEGATDGVGQVPWFSSFTAMSMLFEHERYQRSAAKA